MGPPIGTGGLGTQVTGQGCCKGVKTGRVDELLRFQRVLVSLEKEDDLPALLRPDKMFRPEPGARDPGHPQLDNGPADGPDDPGRRTELPEIPERALVLEGPEDPVHNEGRPDSRSLTQSPDDHLRCRDVMGERKERDKVKVNPGISGERESLSDLPSGLVGGNDDDLLVELTGGAEVRQEGNEGVRHPAYCNTRGVRS